MAASGFTGTFLEQALFSDANLRFPKGRVRLNPGVQISVTPDALLISGPAGRQQLKCGEGKAAIVARLLRQSIDSTTRIVDIEALDNKLLSLLHAAGALEAASGEVRNDRLDAFSGFLAGTRDSARRFSSGDELSEFVDGRRVSFAATPRLREIQAATALDGVAVRDLETDVLLASVGFDVSNPLIDRLLDPRVSDDYSLALVEEAVVHGRKVAPSWLIVSVVVRNNLVRLVLRGDRWFRHAPDLCETCCHGLIDRFVEHASAQPEGDLSLACVLQAQEILNLTAEVNTRPADTSLSLISGNGQAHQSGPLLAYLASGNSCDSCEQDVLVGERTQVMAFTALTDFSERHTIDPKGHQVHYLASNLAAQARPRTTQVISAPPPTAAPGVVDQWSEAAGPDWLATTLRAVRYGVGIRSRATMKVQRYTASGGNMGSTAALIEVTTATGNAFYLYDDQTCGLLDVATHEAPTEPPPAEATARIHLIAGIGRLGPKYGHLAYRISLADVGAALATVQDFASANDLHAAVDWNARPGCSWEGALIGEGRPVVSISLTKESK